MLDLPHLLVPHGESTAPSSTTMLLSLACPTTNFSSRGGEVTRSSTPLINSLGSLFLAPAQASTTLTPSLALLEMSWIMSATVEWRRT